MTRVETLCSGEKTCASAINKICARIFTSVNLLFMLYFNGILKTRTSGDLRASASLLAPQTSRVIFLHEVWWLVGRMSEKSHLLA